MTSEQFHTGLDVLEKLRGGGKGEGEEAKEKEMRLVSQRRSQ